MKTLLIAAVLGACCLFANVNTSSAADHGQVPASTLAQMGLSSMQPMSDVQGLEVRGKGKSKVTIYANTVIISNVLGHQNNVIYPLGIVQVIIVK